MSTTFTQRDHQAARATHRLFWRATFVAWVDLAVWFFTRPTALLVYNVLIPFEVAYGLQAIITRDFNSVGHYALLIFLLGVAYCVLWAIGGVAISRNGKAGIEYVQRKVFVNYLEKDYEFFNATHLGALGSQAIRLKDAYTDYSQMVMNSVTKQVIVVAASVAIIASQTVVLALVTVLSMALVLSFTIVSSKWRLKYRRAVSAANSETAGVVGDALGHGITVKSFATEKYETGRLNESLGKLAKLQYWSWISSIPVDVIRMLLTATATLVLLLLTAQLYQQNAISIAIVVLVQLYVIKLIMATQEIADLVKTYESIMSSAHQAVKTMLIQPTVLDSKNPAKLPKKANSEVVLHGVTYRYQDATEESYAIKNLDLSIFPGEKVGLVGYSGSGKTTLTKLLLRFMDVTEGSITLDGVDVRKISQQELREHIAYVPQEPLLFHRSIADNIAYGKPDATDAAIREAANIAYVDEFVNELPAGYDTIVGERGVKLSGGQRQRVAIARALLKNAPILVLDEATSALDSRSEHYIQQALWRLMQGRTALVIAHRLSTLQRMDRIVVMDKGNIVEVGTHVELLNNPNGIYAQLWSHQSGGYLNNSDINTPQTQLAL